jgi:hypothetical protein
VRYLTKHGADKLAMSYGNDLRADSVMQHHLGFVFHYETLSRAGVESLEQLLELLAVQGVTFGDAEVSTVWQITKDLDSTHRIIPKSEWTPSEEAFTRLLTGNAVYVIDKLVRKVAPQQNPHDYYGPVKGRREIKIGACDTAQAWTDGESYIAFDRSFLNNCGLGRHGIDLEGWVKIAGVFVHEYLHLDDTTTGCAHTPEFYRDFHDLHEHYTSDLAAHFATNWGETLRSVNRKVNKQLLKNIDRLYKASEQSALLKDQSDTLRKLENMREEIKAFTERANRRRR